MHALIYLIGQIPYLFISGATIRYRVRPVKVEILRLLAENQIWLSANNVAVNIGYRLSYVRDELKELHGMELVDMRKNGGPYYRINESGINKLEHEKDT